MVAPGPSNLAPVPVVSATPTSGDYPLVVAFSSDGSTDPDGSIATYSWNFGDGSPLVSTPDATHTYTTAGSFSAKLTVYDNGNKSAFVTTVITVTTPPANLAPTAMASANPSVGKSPLLVTFSSAGSADSDGTISSYSWDFGDGTPVSAEANPDHTFETAGSFNATLTITDDDGGTDTADVAVQVNANVGPTAVANANITGGQVPLTILFSSAGSADTDGGITSYAWDFGDGNSSSSPNPTYSYSIPGSYTATLTVADSEGETDSSALSVTADAIPNVAPTAVVAAVPLSVRQGLPVSFSSLGSGDSDGTITSYDWDFGDGDTSAIANPTHTYALAGSFVATLTLTDNAGGVATATTTVTVTPNLAPTASAVATPTSGKEPVLVSFSSSGSTDSDGTIASYNWDFGDGSANKTTASATHTYGSAGSFTATLTVTDDFGATDTSTVVTVVTANVAPTAVASATPVSGARPLVVNFTGSSSSDSDGNIASYAWDFGDGGTSSVANPSHTYAAGSYSATLVVTDDNGVASVPVSLTISAVIDDDADGFQPPADCNDLNPSIFPAAADPLDVAGIDSNCDGADGQIANTIFVAATGGADSGSCGAIGVPCASISQAMLNAVAGSKSVVQASSGTYSAGFTLTNNLTLRGGYAPGFASRSGTSTVNGSVIASSTTSGATLSDLTINGSGGTNATGVLAQSSTLSLLRVTVSSGTPAGAGSSAYGVRAITGSTVSVVDSTVSAQAGVAGAAGSGVGTAGSAGCNGGGGGNASGPSSPGGGAGSCGGSGVASSGSGGTGGNYSGGGANGSAGGGGASGGGGGCGSLFGCGSGAGNGSGGAAGSGGAGGSGGSSSATSAAALWAGLPGGSGSTGALGGGGGGGGGGSSASASGGGGGAGGAGGGAGAGSSGVGGAGGGSFGVYAHNSSLTVTNSTVNSLAGGTGGAGTSGGTGGAGGGGGGGGSKSCCSAGPGGSGGSGGAGGGGGGAGGGAGGPSISLFHSGSGLLVVSGGTQTRSSAGAGGAGGSGGASTNSGGSGSAGSAGLLLRIWDNSLTTA